MSELTKSWVRDDDTKGDNMNTRDFWMGLCIGFWIGAILGTLTMARAGENCTTEGGYNACVDRNTPVTRGDLGLQQGDRTCPIGTVYDPSSCVDGQIPVTMVTGYLMVDKASVDRLLQEHPDAQVKMALYEYDDTAGMWNRAREPHCLAQMESAMRAMEPFVMPVVQLAWDGRIRNEEHDFEEAQRLWAETTRTCWRQP